MNVTANESYDVVVIMDADNVTTPNFLAEINRAFESGLHAVQAHRTGKNMNTDIAVLDAISEEINNGFFRSGHNAIGLSAGLAGSGMALLKQRIHIEYLEQLPVYDEKTQKKEGIKNQRKRWIAAQYGALRASLPDFPKALIQGNIDYCDKILQWMLPPRLIQLAGVFGFTLLFTAIGLLMSLQSGEYEWYTAIKWWILSAAQVAAMIIPVPGKLLNRKLGKAILQIPTLALAMIANMFRLKGANKKFIHTEHGEE